MAEPNFLQEAFAGKSPQLKQLAVKILNIYLTSPLSSRDGTADERKARIRALIEEAVRGRQRTGTR